MEDVVFACCDECDQIDGDYYEEMHYDPETEMFKCRRGHLEEASRHFRHMERSDLVGCLMDAIKLYYGRGLLANAVLEATSEKRRENKEEM